MRAVEGFREAALLPVAHELAETQQEHNQNKEDGPSIVAEMVAASDKGVETRGSKASSVLLGDAADRGLFNSAGCGPRTDV